MEAMMRNHVSDITDGAARTISVRASRKWCLSRLRAEYPACAASGGQRPPYDVALARELLSRAGEIPFSKRDMLAVLAEYRRALSALAAEFARTSDADRQTETGPH
jgi:hypothetical protein